MTPSAGCLVCVVGPSGAGKDTLIDRAKLSLADDPSIVFPRRLVTREASAAEDNETLTEAAFDDGVAAGSFALHWRAHGLGYALPGSVRATVEQGGVAVCNVSRLAVAPAKTCFPRVATVLITAPEPVRAARIASRGRETLDEATARVARGSSVGQDVVADLVIENVGRPEEGAAALVAFLQALRASAEVSAATS